MSQHSEHNQGDHEDPLAGPTWTVGVVGAVLFAVTVLGVAALTYSVMDRERDEKIIVAETEAPINVRNDLRDEQMARLAGPARREQRPENPDGEISIVIPVDEAIDRFLAEPTVRN